MSRTEKEIYRRLADIAKIGGIGLVLDTQAPTPELILEFLESVVSMERKALADGAQPGFHIHTLQATGSLPSVQ